MDLFDLVSDLKKDVRREEKEKEKTQERVKQRERGKGRSKEKAKERGSKRRSNEMERIKLMQKVMDMEQNKGEEEVFSHYAVEVLEGSEFLTIECINK